MNKKEAVLTFFKMLTEKRVREAYIFCESRASWDNLLESVKKLETFPS